MKRLLLIVCLFIVWGSTAHAARSVYIVDKSTLVHPSDIANALPAFQAAVSEDFAPIWGVDATLVLTDTPPAGAWTVSVEDYSDLPGALGYHGYEGDRVYARVFAASSVENNDSWQGCLTHELFEMLADPYVDRLAFGKRMWLVEVSDPVEADAFNYARKALDGSLVPISDFVTPAWYQAKGHRPFDFRRHVKHRAQVLFGGFAYFWDGYSWTRL